VKYSIQLLFIWISFFANAQNKELKPFFMDKEKLIGGYKNTKGKIIIPAKYTLLNGDEMTTPDCQYVYVLESGKSKKPVLNTESCKVFNKQGKLLYNAYWFDNGPDYFQEGLRRYVEKGKVGFVDYFGNKVIKAEWDDASPFYNGISRVGQICNIGKADEEHTFISCKEYFLINRDGIVISKVDDSMNTDSVSKANYNLVINKPLLAQEVEFKIHNLQGVKNKMDNKEINKDALLFYVKDAAQKPCWLFIFRSSEDVVESECKYIYYPSNTSCYLLNECGNKVKIKL
jgi:hypothetical protein